MVEVFNVSQSLKNYRPISPAAPVQGGSQKGGVGAVHWSIIPRRMRIHVAIYVITSDLKVLGDLLHNSAMMLSIAVRLS